MDVVLEYVQLGPDLVLVQKVTLHFIVFLGVGIFVFPLLVFVVIPVPRE